jgi:hypothetical protein
MAFVPKFAQDVFVSYAHVDNRPLLDQAVGWVGEAPLGWVATLVRLLKNLLDQKLGRKDSCNVWFDSHDLRGHHTLDAEIAAQLQQSAAFVAILSPGYVKAVWCLAELGLFMRSFGAELGNRMFIIEKDQIDVDESLPSELRTLWDPRERQARRGYYFWYKDPNDQPRTFAVPIPDPAEKEYFRLIDDLARDLQSQLKAMREAATGASDQAPQSYHPLTGIRAEDAPCVLLAEVTSDLESRRREVQRYLEQQGVLVLPENPYPLGRSEFERAIDADLRRSELFVQLLGGMVGKRPPEVPEGYAQLQLDRARRGEVAILQWRSPELDLTEIEWSRHRELLELETVRVTSLETFKRSAAAALAPRPSPPTPRQTSNRALVFLNIEPRHREIAAQIREEVGNRVTWVQPLDVGTAEQVRADLEQNVIECDAMVMVYADNASWVRAQLRTVHKLAPRREGRVPTILLINSSDEAQPELGFDLPGMVIADGRGGIGQEVLPRLLESLRL